MKPNISGIAAATFAVVTGFPVSSRAATVVVDWMELIPGGTAGSFSLAADGGLPAGHGALAIESGKGASFPKFPQPRVFNAGSWAGPTGYADSVTGDDRVSGFDLRVASQSGPSAYTLTLDVPAGRELVVAVGGLYRGAGGATNSLALAASGGGAVSFDQALGWSGSDVFDQEIEWDVPAGTLFTTLGSDGESEIAFLRISPLAGGSTLTFHVSSGYGGAGTTGDSISFAVGAVVPEPGVLTLAGLGALLALAARRR
jgi:hypothetical protein